MGLVLCIVFVFVFLSEMRKVACSYKTLVVCLLRTSIIHSCILGFSCLNVLVRLIAFNMFAIVILFHSYRLAHVQFSSQFVIGILLNLFCILIETKYTNTFNFAVMYLYKVIQYKPSDMALKQGRAL